MDRLEHKSILWQAQEVVAAALNADGELSGRVEFFPENRKDIDFQIKNALGRQGIVGVVMTPRAEYQGTYQGEALVWDLRDFTVQVVENPAVNRPLSGSVTALDAAMRASECLASPLLSAFGAYCPRAVEQGEDSGLLVAQAKFDTTVRAYREPPPQTLDPEVTYVKYEGDAEWTPTELSGHIRLSDTQSLSAIAELRVGRGIQVIGWEAFKGRVFRNLKRVEFQTDDPWEQPLQIGSYSFWESPLSALDNLGDVFCESIGEAAFSQCKNLQNVRFRSGISSFDQYSFEDCWGLSSLVFPDSARTIAADAFLNCRNLKTVSVYRDASIGVDAFGCAYGQSITDFEVRGMPTEEIQFKDNYPWGVGDTGVIRGVVGE